MHDLVDYVSDESFKAGKAAAAFVRSEQRETNYITVKDGEGVRGTVPQKISIGTEQPVSLMFRPAAVYRNSVAVAECGGRELCRKKAMIFTPGEMALLTLNPDDLRDLPADTISVRIVRS